MRTTTRSSASTRTWLRSSNRRASEVNVLGAFLWGHLRAGVGPAHRRDLKARSVRAADGILESRRTRCRQSTSAVLLEEDRRDELVAFFMSEVAGLPAGSGRTAALPARVGGAAGGVPTRFRARSERTGNTTSTPDRFQGLRRSELFLQGGDSPAPFKEAAEAVRGDAAGLSRWGSCPASDMPRWIPAPSSLPSRCWAFSTLTRTLDARHRPAMRQECGASQRARSVASTVSRLTTCGGRSGSWPAPASDDER